MKVVIEIDLESDDHDGTLSSVTDYLIDTVKGFIEAIGHDINIRDGARARIGWVPQMNAGCIFEGARKSPTGPISLRFGYAASAFDTDNWGLKYKDPSRISAVEYNPDTGVAEKVKAGQDVEAVEPSAVHDRQVQDH